MPGSGMRGSVLIRFERRGSLAVFEAGVSN